MKKYKLCVFIGRMQPPTLAHINIIKSAALIAENVLVLFGSSYQPRTIKNPFTHNERAQMVMGSLGDEYVGKVTCRGIRDYLYNNAQWAASVQKCVEESFDINNSEIAIIGHKKDSSSFYLDMFPQWDFVNVDRIDGINATDIRDEYFRIGVIFNNVPTTVKNFLGNFASTDAYRRLVKEWKHIRDYKKSWESAPYPPTFVTADAVVEQSGHILMIQRKAAPGEGLWALPGGFVNQNETVKDASIRELREETRLKVPEPVLRGSIEWGDVFDAPDRSLRGRTITYANLIRLPAGKLPAVKGSDDARSAKWIPINDVLNMEEEIFEDHLSIIRRLLGI